MKTKRIKVSTYRSKHTITPGPFTGKETNLLIEPILKPNTSLNQTFYGVYRSTDTWNEKGWYPISINITFDRINEIIKLNGIDEVLTACEKYLNLSNKYGNLIILELISINHIATPPFISCLAKTNKKSIPDFKAIRGGFFKVFISFYSVYLINF